MEQFGHIHNAVSPNSTSARGIFHTKNEGLSGGKYNRMHVICGDANCSQFQSWLKIGTMALVMAALDANKRPGDLIKLSDPVGAMQLISADPDCRETVKLASGEDITAIGIQRRYLKMVEALVGTKCRWNRGCRFRMDLSFHLSPLPVQGC